MFVNLSLNYVLFIFNHIHSDNEYHMRVNKIPRFSKITESIGWRAKTEGILSIECRWYWWAKNQLDWYILNLIKVGSWIKYTEKNAHLHCEKRTKKKTLEKYHESKKTNIDVECAV